MSGILSAATRVPAVPVGASSPTGQYHAAVIVHRVAPLLVLLVGPGCLENLNQQKYFDKLEAAAPELAVRVQRHRLRIEQQLEAVLEAQAPAPPTHIGLWGETWDLVRVVTDGDELFMKGRIFHDGAPASTYALTFTVAEDGTVEVIEGRVFARETP